MPLIMGVCTALVAATAWFRPNTLPYGNLPSKADATDFQLALSYTRESLLWQFRIAAPLFTIVLVGIGIGLITSAFKECGGLNLHGEIAVRYWPPTLGIIAAVLALSLYLSRNVDAKRQAIFAVLATAWSFAASQAAAFHLGRVADTWGAVAFIIWLACAIIAWRWRLTSF